MNSKVVTFKSSDKVVILQSSEKIGVFQSGDNTNNWCGKLRMLKCGILHKTGTDCYQYVKNRLILVSLWTIDVCDVYVRLWTILMLGLRTWEH